MNRVREAKHCRILLKKDSNKKTQWDSILYLTRLKKDETIDAFFAGFQTDRSDWTNDKWNEHVAYSALNRANR